MILVFHYSNTWNLKSLYLQNWEMFINDSFEIDRAIEKSDFKYCTPSYLAAVNSANSQKLVKIPGDDLIASVEHSYLRLDFDVFKIMDDTRYVDGANILVTSGPVASFIESN